MWPAGSGIRRGHPVHTLMWFHLEQKRGGGTALNFSYYQKVLRMDLANVLVLMFSVNAHCISSGWPYDKASLLWYNERIKSRWKKKGQWKNSDLESILSQEDRDHFLCVLQPGSSSPLCFKLLNFLKSRKCNRHSSLWIIFFWCKHLNWTALLKPQFYQIMDTLWKRECK